jgi:hypothetical protein
MASHSKRYNNYIGSADRERMNVSVASKILCKILGSFGAPGTTFRFFMASDFLQWQEKFLTFSRNVLPPSAG